MKLIQLYEEDIASGAIRDDLQQRMVLPYLQTIADQLQTKTGKFRLLWKRKPPSNKGLYLWGGVGIGKTYLMDLFFHHLPTERKKRMHFHVFMQTIQQQLRQYQGKTDPLFHIANAWQKTTDILCFDEFFVNDIADAMILATILDAFFTRGMVMLCTSNCAPDELYQKGLQRQRFLPAIELIKRRMHVHHLQSQHDYRLHYMESKGTYFTPLQSSTNETLMQYFISLSNQHYHTGLTLTINQRTLISVASASNVVWFEFDVLCHSPRSQEDYLALTREYAIIFVSQVPQLTDTDLDRVIYFIYLIDILYDAKVKLILSASVPINELYQGQVKAMEFNRTTSRLVEMQSVSYWQQSR